MKVSKFLFGFLIVILALTFLPVPILAPTYLVDLSKWDAIFRIPTFSIPNTQITTYNDSNQFQFNLTLRKRPALNYITINILTANLAFYYQPPLNQELNVSEYDFVNATHAILNGEVMAYRPENVVGSYAVYSNHQNNEYGTGKLFHIYRPLLIDAEGLWSWANLTMTGTALTITADSLYLSNAIYPIVIDPSFGYATIGASSETFASSTYEYILGTVFPGAAGTVTEMHMTALRASTGSDNIHVGLYVDSTSTLLADFGDLSCSMATSTRWFNWTGLNQAVEAVDYMLVAQGDYTSKQINTNYDTGDTGQGHSNQTIAYGAFPSSITWSAATTRKRSIYVNYTEGGGPAAYVVDLAQAVTAGFTVLLQTTFQSTLSFSSSVGFTVLNRAAFTVVTAFSATAGFLVDLIMGHVGVSYFINLALNPTFAFLSLLKTNFKVVLSTNPTVTITDFLKANYNLVLILNPGVGLLIDLIFEHITGIRYYVNLLFNPTTTITTLLNANYNIILGWNPTTLWELVLPGVAVTTADLALALAGLAFIVAMTGIGLFALRRRD